MRINKATAGLIIELEYMIGSECYNPNSYDGYTGEEGRKFRYPVTAIRTENDDEYDWKYRGSMYDISPKNILSAHYKFGSNRLLIGRALEQVLTHLEERYDLDIAVLEKEYQRKKKVSKTKEKA